jgi:hypothetical protein
VCRAASGISLSKPGAVPSPLHAVATLQALRLPLRIVLRSGGPKTEQINAVAVLWVHREDWGCAGSRDLRPPLDRHDGSPPSSTPAAPDALLEVEYLGPRVEPEPQRKFRRQQRHAMAGGAIDLDEIPMPEILDPCQV